jgi:hypothetical protein
VDEAVVTNVAQIDAAWLSRALSRRVLAFQAEPLGGDWSRIVRITPRYEPGAGDEGPSALCLKMCSGSQAVFGDSEVSYYTRDYVGCEDAPIPRCHHAAYDAATRNYHLLLEDLSATHGATWDLPKTLAHGLAVAEALARLHSHRWGKTSLANVGVSIAGEAEFSRYFAHVRAGLNPLFETLGSELEPKWREALTSAFEHHGRVMRDRAESGVGFTLVHGDVNPGNILAPRNGARPVYLIDRQPFDWSLQCWLGASDLAYLMVLFWEPEQRRAWQFEILRHYQAELRLRGVEFSWDQLLWDYRFSVVQALESAVEWLVKPEDRAQKRWIWEPQLKRSLQAFFELDCGRLWSETAIR